MSAPPERVKEVPPEKGPVFILGLAEDLVHYAVAAVLLMLAGMALWKTATDLVHQGDPFSTRVTNGINDVLFVIIVIELLHTIIDHFEHAGLQLKPFLIIGIISAVRHILTIGARLTLTSDTAGTPFSHPQIELGVNTAVVLGLAVALLLVRYARDDDD